MRFPPELVAPEDAKATADVVMLPLTLPRFMTDNPTDTAPINSNKSACRQALSRQRKQAHDKWTDAATDIIRQFHLCYDRNWQGVYVSGYLPIGSEIDIVPLMEELRNKGAIILMPAIIAADAPLQFRLWDKDTVLIEESFGTRAPDAASPAYLPDVICTPLLGFDEDAYRLGYGGGFYDRSIAHVSQQKSLTTIGFAYDEQKSDALPKESHDVQLHAIITPTRFYSGQPQEAKE